MKTYNICPVAKPRMTRQDKWKKRPCVLKYRAFCDELNYLQFEIPACGSHITFYLPMPKSWSKKKMAEMDGEPHQQTPDIDNLLKAVMDAIYKNDSHIWDCRITKRWAYFGKITIDEYPVLV